MNRFFEELSMNAWPSIKSVQYDGWVLRYANKYTKRANSVVPLYESTLDMNLKLAYCEAFYNRFAMPTTFKLHDGEALHALDIYLEDNGYHVLDPTDVMTMDLNHYEVAPVDDYRVEHGYSEEGAKALATMIGLDDDSENGLMMKETMKTMMSHIIPDSFYIFIEKKGEVVATGNGVVEQGYVGVFNMSVNKNHRGQGYGKQLMMAILKEGKALGAVKSYLQVVCKNEVALNLYKGLGYEKAYTYWYRRKDKQEF